MASDARAHESGLRHELGAGKMAMVGVGGSIGTGLFLGAGAAVHIAGPAVIISYALGALIAWTVTMALGEMASRHPSAGSFGTYGEMFLHPWAGFVARYGYWFSVFIALGGQLVAAATYARLWFPEVNPLVWIALFAAVLLAINFQTVGHYGAFEYWFAMVKVVAVLAFILLGAFLLFGGRTAPQYTAHGGFFPNSHISPLLAISFALYSFLGVEMVAISSGEARSGSEVPRATAIMFALLTVVYVGATAVLVGVIPWTLAGVDESPFVTVFRLAGLDFAAGLTNFVVITAALSGANANIYVASRMLFSLSRGGYAPRRLGQVNRHGVPIAAVAVSCLGIFIAAGMQYWVPGGAYLYLIGAALFGGMLAWCVALAAHLVFRRRLSNEELHALPMRSPGGATASIVGLIAVIAVVISTAWVPESRITIVSGGPYLVVLTAAYALARWRTKKRMSPRARA
jgi:L-asparagine transporter-like permease